MQLSNVCAILIMRENVILVDLAFRVQRSSNRNEFPPDITLCSCQGDTLQRRHWSGLVTCVIWLVWQLCHCEQHVHTSQWRNWSGLVTCVIWLVSLWTTRTYVTMEESEWTCCHVCDFTYVNIRSGCDLTFVNSRTLSPYWPCHGVWFDCGIIVVRYWV